MGLTHYINPKTAAALHGYAPAAHADAARQAGIAGMSARLALLVHACSAVAAADNDEALGLFEQAVSAPGADRWSFDLARTRGFRAPRRSPVGAPCRC
jgi:hypothetical protein